jgi:hypothetical protein
MRDKLLIGAFCVANILLAAPTALGCYNWHVHGDPFAVTMPEFVAGVR